MNIEKIIITGDFLRLDSNGGYCQTINIKWLYRLLAPLFAQFGEKWRPGYVVGGNGTTASPLAEKMYASAAMQPCLESWIRIFDGNLNHRQLALLEDTFSNALIIGFELPFCVIKGFCDLGIPYLDFTIHPARFLRQLPLGVKSNIAGLEQVLEPWRIFESQLYIEAGMAKAKLGRKPLLKSCAAGENIGVFACQTTADRSLISHGSLLKINDFMDSLESIFSKHDTVLVKGHPYEPDSNSKLYLTQLYANAVECMDNIYQLMCQDNVGAIYSLTSGASIEAPYFDIKGIHLAEPILKFSYNGLSRGSYASIKACLLEIRFWQNLFRLMNMKIKDCVLENIEMDMRASLDSYWGADILFK